MIPTEKDPKIDEFITNALGIQRKKSIQKEICSLCHKKINPEIDFRDNLSLKEYRISGMCQECQDKIFGY